MTDNKECTCPNCQLIDKLEVERNDASWKTPGQIDRTPETIKQLYFNAGRFAAGARDNIATDAHRKLEKLGEA